MSDQKMHDFLSSIIESAAYLRDKVNIPDNDSFRESLFEVIKEADSLIDDAASMVNDFDLSEWEN